MSIASPDTAPRSGSICRGRRRPRREPVVAAPPLQPARQSNGRDDPGRRGQSEAPRHRCQAAQRTGFQGHRNRQCQARARYRREGTHDKVDLLFTDVVLPGDMDGFALARQVQAVSRAGPEGPVDVGLSRRAAQRDAGDPGPPVAAAQQALSPGRFDPGDPRDSCGAATRLVRQLPSRRHESSPPRWKV